jgi:hypothetical protein
MIDYELMRSELEERLRRAERGAELRRLMGGPRRSVAGRGWTAAVRTAVGLGVARLGLLLAGGGAVRAH